MKQYAEGAAFVRKVVDQAGMDGFNRVWTSPNTLPTPPRSRTRTPGSAASSAPPPSRN